MSLVVNTNVSSLTAQRALAYADSLQGEAMQRLSTGSKINSAADDAAVDRAPSSSPLAVGAPVQWATVARRAIGTACVASA